MCNRAFSILSTFFKYIYLTPVSIFFMMLVSAKTNILSNTHTHTHTL